MKRFGTVLILIGSGLTTFGIFGFQARFGPGVLLPDQLAGSAGWSLANQVAIVIGVLLLILGVILRIDSRQPK
jgi:hypothetical protein